jgi:hypothetical protein
MAFAAVFARPNHPDGWGICCGGTEHKDHVGGTAHGYVLALVQCSTMDEAELVKNKLQDFPGLKWDDRTDDWYGGPMDLVAVVPSLALPQHASRSPWAWASIGDNRACAILRAEDILRA